MKLTVNGNRLWKSLLLDRKMDEGGAGHDAEQLASICPTAMVFVLGGHDGISHNPGGYSTPQQCARGVDILLQAPLELAG